VPVAQQSGLLPQIAQLEGALLQVGVQQQQPDKAGAEN
jgi:hypothetical protein